MQEHELSSPSPIQHHPLKVILLTLITAFLGFTLVGPLVGTLVVLPFYDGGMMEFLEALQKPVDNPDIKVPLYMVQGCATLIGLIVAPSLLLYTLQRSVFDFLRNQSAGLFPFILTFFIVIIFMGVNSFFIEWNAGINFPEPFERWARSREDYAAEVTRFLTRFDSIEQFLLAFAVIAILPAIGEELVFRGLLQKEFIKLTKNPHVSIWVAAFLFSSIHVQFYGFVPRMLLGALFGYLYYWSGSLTIAIVAHFVNNGFAVVGLYLHQQGTVDFDVEKPEALPWTYIILSAILTGMFLYYFKKYFTRHSTSLDH